MCQALTLVECIPLPEKWKNIWVILLYPVSAGYAWTDNFMVLFGILVGLNDVVNGLVNIPVTSLQGYLYENVGVETIFHTTVGYGSCLCILVHIMNLIGNRHGERKIVSKDAL